MRVYAPPTPDRPAYLLGAVVADPDAGDGMRDALAGLPRRGRKLH